ncbi:endonuclease/exonuclease/phosphatase family protein [Sodiomyces alkalinus F11]|uniref:Endonuclease/exonuclease/phosphatase family protein n=1 Tax=Sodiomyces alkalinus (strain CBS 110278 / VKM F-3762 / F11) TaxID=1314773 RepID=A0A3N2Q6Z9_SODAK|nr:endonuclease/exonuclease/phosphatase family protein [Sodiomyces alkalinus F11]ROT42544.1 endonuclease/exonuclease/phosphatase family protein [Sodiomyces alkalinus F11]
MKTAALFSTAAALMATVAACTTQLSVNPRLISYNIRLATNNPGAAEPRWRDRLPALLSQLNYETAARPESLVCMQEVVPTQLADVAAGLGRDWNHVGVGRDDGKNCGEFSPIFYRPDTWDMLANTTYWLSPTPDVPGSRGWDAALPRIVTVAHLRHIKSGLPFVYMCTHFDHVGQVARVESARLLVRLARKYARSTSSSTGASEADATPVFLGGDLNIRPDNPAYLEMIAPGHYHDVRHVVGESRIHGHFYTFTGFHAGNPPQSSLSRIDHIFVWRKEARNMDLLTYGVVENRFDDGLWISDHRAVVVDVNFQVTKECEPRAEL